jgi:CHAT domain-containing protein/tetratricopeptide (TPR) repeat protein
MRARNRLWPHLGGKRRLSCAVIVAVSLLSISCNHNQRESLEKQYLQSRLDFQGGHDDQARRAAHDGLDRSGKHPDLAWRFRILQAEILVRHEDPAAAIKTLDLPLSPGSPYDVIRRRALVLASAQCKLGINAEADLRFAEAARYTKNDPAIQAEISVAQGRCEIGRRNLDAAQKLFEQALQKPQVDGFTLLDASHGQALCAIRKGQFESGIDLLQPVLQASRALKNDYWEERILGSLGYAYAELGAYNQALENSRAAEELAGKSHQDQDQYRWQTDTGRAYLALGKSGLAKDYFKRALSSARLRNDLFIVALCLHNLTLVAIEEGSTAEAVRYHEELGRLKLQGLDLLYWRIDESTIAARKGDPSAERLLLALLPDVQSIPRLNWSVSAGLARLYDRQGDTVRADQWFRRTVEKIAADTRRLNHVEFQAAARASTPYFAQYVAFLVAHNQTDRSFQVGQLARAQSLAEELGVKRSHNESAHAWVARIQSMLRSEKAVALAYNISVAGTFVWVVNPTHLTVNKLDIKQEETETLVASYNREIADHADLASSSTQKKLYQLLIKPVRHLIPKGTHVFLVGDSWLYRINFETLISDEGQPHYWIDDVEIENASSLDLLMAGQGLHRKGRGLFLLGAPEEADPNYPRLPNAPLEMEDVQKHFPSVEVKAFSGKDAFPEAYVENHPGLFKYIHLATHGTTDADDSLNSAVILSKGPRGAFQLYARDIVRDDLKLNADLVTISTCYGAGKGGAAEEGMLGLQRAFLRAGAHQVIAALWNVDDASNPALMDRLYEGISKHETPSQALRAAKLKLVHSGDFHSSPYYWAPLQIYTGR